MKKIPIVCLCILVLTISCRKQPAPLAQGWSSPTKITDTEDSLVGNVVLYKWHNTVIALQPQAENSAKCFLMDSNNNSWSEASLTGIPRWYFWWWPVLDQDSDKVFFEQGYMENDQLIMNVLVGRLVINESLAVRNTSEKKWITNTKTFFGENRSNNIRLTERLGTRDWPELSIGIVNGADLDIPYSLGGFTLNEKGVAVDRGPYVNGVFHSSDSGTTWQMERISDSQAFLPSICRSKGYYYYFAASPSPKKGQGFELCFARKPVTDSSWEEPKAVTKFFDNLYVAASQDDTIHLCWLDARHEKRTGNAVYPHEGNYEVAYSQRKDSDNSWSKEIILSEGLLFTFSPSMSVEGDKIVIAWAGIQRAGVWHTPFDPNDIYYVTSKDGGKTWTEPLRVTDNIKVGVTAGDPQVVLLNGKIHLTYIQGKMNLKQESPGLTKLNQPPWPIYYMQRPFPD